MSVTKVTLLSPYLSPSTFQLSLSSITKDLLSLSLFPLPLCSPSLIVATMKLRIRSLESKETHRIEVPNTYNLQQLKELISEQLSLSSSSSSSSVLGNLVLSLNRKDELFGSSPEETLQSIGLTSGDLIYYSRNSFAFSSQNPNLSHAQLEKPLELEDLMDTQKFESGKLDELVVGSDQTREFVDAQMEGSSELTNPNAQTGDLVNSNKLECGNSDELVGRSAQTRELMDAHMGKSLKLSDPNNQTGDTLETAQSIEETEGDDEMEVDDESVLDAKARFSVPSFLKKVFVKEVGDATNGDNHKLLVIAVHAVLMESGFVGYDPVSGMKVDGFHLPDEWPSSAFGISLHYTLPEVSSFEMVETVVVKFQTLGRFVNVYGTLPKKGFGVHRVCLDEPRFVPSLSFVWKKTDCTGLSKESDESMKLFPNREIFEFWKIVKDGLSYPLLIELCDKLGLVPPPCFMRLPTELKLKILESLPAIDVARVGCVCSELRFVSSNNDLWRSKYEEEFGNVVASQRECQWKAKFASAWDIKKKRKRVCMPYSWREPHLFRPLFPGRRDPNPLGYPFIIGGDYDRLPALGIPPHHGPRIFRMNCDLGGFGP